MQTQRHAVGPLFDTNQATDFGRVRFGCKFKTVEAATVHTHHRRFYYYLRSVRTTRVHGP